ncbi:MAG: hypothetical protein WC947_06530 [Elusimicrobiota bacterium]|nr:hypothetical protein [Elusimicrobiota bacterium]
MELNILSFIGYVFALFGALFGLEHYSEKEILKHINDLNQEHTEIFEKIRETYVISYKLWQRRIIFGAIALGLFLQMFSKMFHSIYICVGLYVILLIIVLLLIICEVWFRIIRKKVIIHFAIKRAEKLISKL